MADPNSSSPVRALFELLRLPNLFTALADVAMGFLVTHEALEPVEQFALLAAASACLYLSGMVLNDYFDRDVDLEERPGRPIPSGRISPAFARRLGWALLIAGIVAGWLSGMLSASVRSGLTATLLAGMVVSY
ncbi:MAG TPA: UbiA family prenyltransferase, partial [Pirellulales bacterium]|nr:UbiA family prenyltransferase [Pirellulales bacterium]